MGVVDLVYRTSVRKGVFGGNRRWFAIAVATWSFRQARRVISRREVTVLKEELRPGESLLITHTVETAETLG